jgi:hypothetical protein
MGNRGCLHNDRREVVSDRWTTKTWLICQTAFNGYRRELMRPGHYTELFFLDEATALAAGHRPCAECRRADYKRFREAYAEGNGLPTPLKATDLDRHLHQARTAARPLREAQTLPDGAMFATNGRAWLKSRDVARPWSFEGYGPVEHLPAERVTVLTPEPTLKAIAAGYAANTAWRPQSRCP